MRVLYFLLAIPWVAVGIGFLRIIEEQGKLIGGSQYFSHLGLASGIAAEYALVWSCFALCAGLVALTFGVSRLANAIRYFSFVVALAVVFIYIGFLVNIPVFSHIQNLVVRMHSFPSGYGWVPLSALGLAALTGILSGLAVSKAKARRGNAGV
jgi:hypothetical protein